MNKQFYLLTLVTAMLALQPASAGSQMGNNQMQNPAPSSSQQQAGWLGVGLGPIPRALSAQLAALMPDGQGILVEQVEMDSPAAIAGIQPYDILLGFENQKLYTPGQLSSLVRSTRAGSQITLQLLRGGQLMSLQVEITPYPASPMNSRPSRFSLPFPPMQRQLPKSAPGMRSQSLSSLAWDSFESVRINTLADGRYHAEVSFKDRDNETKTFSFEGKKEEIIQQIQQQADLPADKRDALLDALNMQGDRFPAPFNAPLMQENPFNAPFFQRNPFDDPFFHDSLYWNYPTPGGAPFFDPSMWPRSAQPHWYNR